MLSENYLVPFSASILPKGKLIVFAPHPDDEIIGLGGTLLQAKAQGSDLVIVYLTSGDLGGDSSVRKDEASEVCRRLGAKPIFLDWPDRSIAIDDHYSEVIERIFIAEVPDLVFAPSPQEYHIDHRATAHLVSKAIRHKTFSVRLFHYEICKQNESNFLVDITKEFFLKKELMAVYKSQTVQNNYMAVMESVAVSRTYTLPHDVEYAESFFEVKAINQPLSIVYSWRSKEPFVNTRYQHFPVISYLVRTKNRKDFLIRCLNSLKKQSYEKIEVVIVNDGGDAVDDIAESYRDDFFRLKCISLNESSGRSAAANTALINATGDYINFLDDDDEIHTNHTRIFLTYLRRDDRLDILYRGVEVVSQTGEKLSVYNDRFDLGRLMHANYIPINAVTFSRKFIDLGCRFDEGMQYFEDWDFWLQLSRLGNFRHVPEVTATYHMVGDSAASPHMEGKLDKLSHMQKVKDKWRSKWTSVEHGLLERYLINS
ncbi:PIG-L family deacetylase [Bacterioplanoides sp. SCSIO 12839]|uniref:PIG-L family deacetylase n=1 Tax=Bacterioplanoides sp. SCSIO 12839 TaxID=2829569 RepID=UPI002101E942|nr:PIG-L family deacetylase [Bacterioplanoides sp. SCSIO 12839]UTW47825.1 PIG-L family deacetylase [Bacterioplanoides sp. SCSIO 12839]